MDSPPRATTETGPRLLEGIAVIVLVGAALGIGSNLLQHKANPKRALDWVRVERKLPKLEELAGAVAPATDPASAGPGVTSEAPESASPPPGAAALPPPAVTPPPAPRTAPDPASLPAAGRTPEPAATTAPVVAATPPPTPAPDTPVVPESREPIEAQLGSVKRLFDAGAAVFVDARTAGEFAEGHIPGAMNIPYDDVFRDPDRLKGFSSKGRPVVVYCGGGDCELSRNLAWALVEEGEKRVLVFLGGTAEWERAGYPMSSGGTP